MNVAFVPYVPSKKERNHAPKHTLFQHSGPLLVQPGRQRGCENLQRRAERGRKHRGGGVATWVKIDGWGKGDKPYPRIIDGPAFYFHPTQGSDGLAGLTLGVRLSDGVSSWNFPALLPEKQWTHVAVTMGGVSPYDSGLPRIFINGKDADVRPTDHPMPAVFAGGTAWLGNSRKDGDRPFEGCLGNVTYETRRMADEEIADMAQVSPDGTRPKEIVKPCHDELPIVDISREKFRQTVIAMGTPDVYQGHPTTVLTKDGKTIFCVWTFQHGGPCGPMARSDDGGKTWKRLDSILPPAYAATHRNCPTLQAVNTPDGAERRFCIFSAKKGGMGILMSRDEGESWYEVPPAKLSAGMPPTGFIQLKDGTSALFGQIRTNPAVKTDGPTDDQDVHHEGRRLHMVARQNRRPQGAEEPLRAVRVAVAGRR